ncbi:Sugar and other transporter [Aspergillus sclerotialis]|uniref:Sugar and other transporter n=1 Tax=Aspergillus sclerotialis TaxID=2070753 RepID=A0A3A2ZWS8_9EURO|nr:Sugar and other transporter [Aspergillus sclerotialis]
MATTSIPDDIVPGTVRLVGLDESPYDDQRKLRTHIELVPKPSSDPNDPLNWSRPRKLLLFAMIFVYTLGIGIRQHFNTQSWETSPLIQV